MNDIKNHQSMENLKPILKECILELCELVQFQSECKWKIGNMLLDIKKNILECTNYQILVNSHLKNLELKNKVSIIIFFLQKISQKKISNNLEQFQNYIY
jgi:hypothetical protein